MLTTTTCAPDDLHLSPVAAFFHAYWNAKRAIGLANWLRHRERAHDRGVLTLLERDLAQERPTPCFGDGGSDEPRPSSLGASARR